MLVSLDVARDCLVELEDGVLMHVTEVNFCWHKELFMIVSVDS